MDVSVFIVNDKMEGADGVIELALRCDPTKNVGSRDAMVLSGCVASTD